MARPGWPERNRAAKACRQLRRFHHVINADKVFGTHRAECTANASAYRAHARFLSPKVEPPYGQKIKTARKSGSYPSRRSLAACRPLRFFGAINGPSWIAGKKGGTHGVGTYPGLHHGNGRPGA